MKPSFLVLIYLLLAVLPSYGTTIAWDGKLLACDSQMTKGHAKLMCRSKFVRSEARHAVLAGAGDVKTLDKIKKFFLETDKPLSELKLEGSVDMDAPVPLKKVPDFGILVVPDVGDALYYESDLSEGIKVTPPWSFGTGEDFAMAAMTLGFDAAKAIEVAKELDIYTGGTVHTVKAPQPETVEADNKKK